MRLYTLCHLFAVYFSKWSISWTFLRREVSLSSNVTWNFLCRWPVTHFPVLCAGLGCAGLDWAGNPRALAQMTPPRYKGVLNKFEHIQHDFLFPKTLAEKHSLRGMPTSSLSSMEVSELASEQEAASCDVGSCRVPWVGRHLGYCQNCDQENH